MSSEAPLDSEDSVIGMLLDDTISVIDSEWYDAGLIVPDYDTVRSLLSSGKSDIELQRASLQNVLAKLMASSGDSAWQFGWTRYWFDECVRLVRQGQIATDQGGFEICGRERVYYESTQSTKADSESRLVGGVVGIACVTRQRVYVEVDHRFRSVLEDNSKFGKSQLDLLFSPKHVRNLRQFLANNGMDPDAYSFDSWREKRAKGSLQCVLATSSSEDGRHFVDIDIDEWNPYADVIGLKNHQSQNTDHLALQDEGYFLNQNNYEVRDLLVWIRRTYGNRSTL